MLELFSPQKTPKVEAPKPTQRVVDWRPGMPLPWEDLDPPARAGKTRMVWRHNVFLGVYDIESTYERLHRVFGEDQDAYDERPAGRSACAALTIDQDGRLVAESAVLSSALWAVAHLDDCDRWSAKWPVALESFTEAIDAADARRRSGDDDCAPAQDEGSVQAMLEVAHAAAGITGLTELATDRILIQSVAVSANRVDESSSHDFLNSFYLDDLRAVAENLSSGGGRALARYLTPDAEIDSRHRIDVRREPQAIDSGVTLERLPKGRWPSEPKHGLALSQQFAVNHALNDLALSRGLMGVNGPPGTGKTTMLRDILAGNVVERARRLAALERPDDAFTSVTHTWDDGKGFPRTVRQLRPELTGFEMVVASANNGAVENVSAELPARDAIGEHWRDSADYFADIATAVMTEANGGRVDAAWGIVAATLGNKKNRTDFHSAFWFDKPKAGSRERIPGTAPRMQARLKAWADGSAPHPTWNDAREAFASAESLVDALIEQRHAARRRLEGLPRLIEKERALEARAEQANAAGAAVSRDLAEAAAARSRADAELARATGPYGRHLAEKPGMLETLFSLGRAIRDWRAELAPLAEDVREAERRVRDAEARDGRLRDSAERIRSEVAALDGELAQTRTTLRALRTACAADRRRYGRGYPGEDWTGERRELCAPWLDAELDEARSDLFLAALQLHRDFVACTASVMSKGLRAAMDVVTGAYPRHLEPEKILAAWQLFFLVVPLVSTTFASFGRMFRDLGPESLGWILIDEAGQAPPQYAAGAIWRAQRVVAVGDPLQLEPVVTMPPKSRSDIAHAYRLGPTWIPPRASVQTLADRVATHGTMLTQGDEDVWVSAPLRVHRRCDDPMFSLCNSIAYDGFMVNGVPRGSDEQLIGTDGELIAPSFWADTEAPTKGGHLQQNQIGRFERALDYLAGQGIGPDQVIAISPFRAVADALRRVAARRPGLTAGTIHTAQGKESAVVFLVLGGDPGRPGAKAWAASTVNLVNVATSRAQRRLYVIGDRDEWARHNYFRQLSDALS